MGKFSGIAHNCGGKLKGKSIEISQHKHVSTATDTATETAAQQPPHESISTGNASIQLQPGIIKLIDGNRTMLKETIAVLHLGCGSSNFQVAALNKMEDRETRKVQARQCFIGTLKSF